MSGGDAADARRQAGVTALGTSPVPRRTRPTAGSIPPRYSSGIPRRPCPWRRDRCHARGRRLMWIWLCGA
jgi:hypothetical protein